MKKSKIIKVGKIETDENDSHHLTEWEMSPAPALAYKGKVIHYGGYTMEELKAMAEQDVATDAQ